MMLDRLKDFAEREPFASVGIGFIFGIFVAFCLVEFVR